ncbi:DeoR family transcriptional regulator [Rhizobiales bacterium RZME27]|jgi:DeoR/GlpR family transcriptional regulator of sugar metabolism|uniref:DeoR family transcriptional regulator n=1 Tax=Endobacterium cereale TaxID=2663029 RepID=A0A6A8A6B1_9HYPH|nr:DeoR/GlpR family DNA-binding transcription regulator [Endobacterium cereale]MEB2846513.1 DeoR/GlpR family DNA-binding transcription regulator [Endobacterium cereale]MQY45387.1 DeoR family transcriptional regulator [Endobacterium cereale]
MLTTERKALLLDSLGKEGRIIAKDFSEKLGLSEDTIRRDLRELAGEGLLQRVHGGALPVSKALGDLPTRRNVSADDKAEIAKVAAGMVKEGQIIFLDGGTTTIRIARALPKALKATVVTHSPDVATALLDHPGVDVELIGGRIYKHSNVSVGSVAIEAIGHIRTDLYFMGVTGIHLEHGLTTGDREEAAVKRAICRQAAETIVLGSREKLGAVSPYSVVSLDDIDGLLVSRKCPEDLLGPLRQAPVQIVGISS